MQGTEEDAVTTSCTTSCTESVYSEKQLFGRTLPIIPCLRNYIHDDHIPRAEFVPSLRCTRLLSPFAYYSFTFYEQRTPRPTPAPTTPAPTVSYPASMGCYMDKKDDRVLTNMLTSPSMTPLVCAAHCSSYPYYATQYGNEVKFMVMKK